MPESTFAKCSPRCASDVATKSAAAWIFRSIMVGAAPCAYTESAAVSVQHRCSSEPNLRGEDHLLRIETHDAIAAIADTDRPARDALSCPGMDPGEIYCFLGYAAMHVLWTSTSATARDCPAKGMDPGRVAVEHGNLMR